MNDVTNDESYNVQKGKGLFYLYRNHEVYFCLFYCRFQLLGLFVGFVEERETDYHTNDILSDIIVYLD